MWFIFWFIVVEKTRKQSKRCSRPSPQGNPFNCQSVTLFLQNPKVLLRAYSKWRSTYSGKSTKSQKRVKGCGFELFMSLPQYKIWQKLCWRHLQSKIRNCLYIVGYILIQNGLATGISQLLPTPQICIAETLFQAVLAKRDHSVFFSYQPPIIG